MPTVVVSATRPERPYATLLNDEIHDALPGTTPIKLLSRLPGVNYTGSEDFGYYEWGNDLSIRGFSAGQIGWMLDDIPLGSTHYWYNSGLDLHRAISQENLGQLTLVPGSGSPDLASYSALGGGVVASTDNPAQEAGFRTRLTAGSHGAFRAFGRIDSGATASGGLGFASLSTLTSDKWKGVGSPGQSPWAVFNRDDGNAVTGAGARWGNYHDQLNLKWVQPLGAHQLTLYADYSDKRENDYADLSLKDYGRVGRNFDNWTNWRDALSGDETVYYGSAMSWRRDTLLAATLKLQLGEGQILSLTPYFHRDEGNGDWHMPDIEDGVVTDMVFRRSKLDLRRSGINSRWNLQVGEHQLSAGAWLEQGDFDRRRYLYRLVDWHLSPMVDFSAPATALLDRRYHRTVEQVFLQDRYAPIASPWAFSAGAKLLRVTEDFEDRLGVYASHRLVTASPVLPQLGASYRLAPNEEVFANLAKHINAKPETVFTQRVFDDSFKPERSTTLEAGWRKHWYANMMAISAYRIRYDNRLLQIANCSLLGTCPSLLANVGSVTSDGIEARWHLGLTGNWAWSGSLAYNRARYDQDYSSNGTPVNTAGKRVVNAPDRLAFSELRYTSGGWFAAADVQHTGRRAASYTNDLTVPGFTLFNLIGGWETRGGPWGAQRSGISWQLLNVANKDYIATLGSSGYYASDRDGGNTYVQVGAPRGAYVTVFATY